MDRKTLRAINRGDSVKHSTLEKVTNKLKIPVQHLLESGHLSQRTLIDKNDANSVLLRSVKATDIQAWINDRCTLKWKVLLDRIDRNGRKLVLDFSRFIDDWNEVLEDWEPSE